MLSRLPSHLAVALFWLLHWLPLPVLAVLGQIVGEFFYRFASNRRHIVMVNLGLCFPELDPAARERLARAHFRALGRSLLERGLLWWASEARLKRLIRLEGAERLRALLDTGRPVIMLAPHFLGLDMGGSRVAMEFDSVSIYARQKNRVFDRWLFHGRSRFGNQLLLSRQDGVRGTVKAMKAGRPFYYLPDMDYGRKDAIFVPFFGVPAATVTALPELMRDSGAVALPAWMQRQADGRYRLVVEAQWQGWPTGDAAADAARYMAELEAVVRRHPAQYLWVHRRFKTRPPGEPGLYA